MKKMSRIVIPGMPKGKERPRFAGHVYTPRQTEDYEQKIRETYLQNGFDRLEGPIAVEIIATFAIPKKTSRDEKEKMLRNEIYPLRAPDCDNIAKIVLDALNKVAYADDKQVVFLAVMKDYAIHANVTVTLWELDHMGDDNDE